MLNWNISKLRKIYYNIWLENYKNEKLWENLKLIGQKFEKLWNTNYMKLMKDYRKNKLNKNINVWIKLKKCWNWKMILVIPIMK